MGETVFLFIIHLSIIGIVFGAYIAFRNRFFKTEEYGTFEDGDQYVLLLLLYMFFLFMPFDINGLYRRLLIHESYYFGHEGFVWIPFTYLNQYQDYMNFLKYVGRENSELLNFIDVVKYYIQLLIWTLPVAYLIHKLNTRKWLGLIFTILVLGIGLGISQTVFIGDGVAIGAIGYLLVAGVSRFMKQGIAVQKTWLNYIVFGVLVIAVLVSVMRIEVGAFNDGKLIKKIPFEQDVLTYNDLIRVNFEEASLYEGGFFDRSIVFGGNLDFDKAIFEECPEELRGLLSKEDIRVSHEYSFEGKHQGMGTNEHDFLNNTEEYTFNRGLELRDYDTFVYDEDGEIIDERLRERVGDGSEYAVFFEYYGISEVSFNLREYTELSEFEILKQGFGRDEYLYYEVMYKTKRYPDIDFSWYVTTHFMDVNGEIVRSNHSNKSVVEETDDYVIERERYYFYNDVEDKVKDIEVEVYGGQLRLETVEEESLFKIDKEIFQ